MESSHRRIINDLEEKHRQEIQRLLCEKEQALAEETQVKLFELTRCIVIKFCVFIFRLL